MTVDVEDWFHILDNNLTAGADEWARFPSKVESMTLRFLDIFARTGVTATFFVLGYVARRYPDLVKEIAACGHELATHSDMHQLVYLQNKLQFERDLVDSIDAIYEATGVTIDTYRAPGFSITGDCLWAFDILARNGIKVDCSIFPAARAHGGMAEFNNSTPCKIRLKTGQVLKELPMSTIPFFGRRMVYGGGGYFRLLPKTLIDLCMQNSNYNMTYFHPRDLEVDQPEVPGLNAYRKFKSTVGLKKAEQKFKRLVEENNFVSVSQAVKEINWTNVDTVDLHRP